MTVSRGVAKGVASGVARGVAGAGGSGAVWSPTDVADLSLWLDSTDSAYNGASLAAAGDPVSEWRDKSGNGYHAVQATGGNQPIFNTESGKSGIVFSDNVVFRYFQLAAGQAFNSRAFSWFVVLGHQATHDNQTGMAATSLVPTLTSCEFLQSAYGVMSSYDALPVTSISATVTDDVYFAVGGASDCAVGKGAISVAGTAFSAATPSGGFIGDFVGDGARKLVGIIREIVTYSRALTSDERNAVVRGLSQKWSIGTAARTKQVSTVGDSITWGAQATNLQGYPRQLAALLDSSWYVHNYGIPGQQLDQMNTDFAATAGFRYNGSFAVNKLVIWGGTNDIAIGGLTGAQTYTRLQTLVSTATTAGYAAADIIVLTMLPRTGTDTERAAYNAAILGGSGYVVVDAASDPRLDDNTDTTYFNADQLHLNNAGYAVAAELVEAALNA